MPTVSSPAALALALALAGAWPSVAHADAILSVQGGSVQAGLRPTSLPFVLQRSGDLAFAVQVHYMTKDGTAVAGRDYQATQGTAVIPAGQSSVTVNVPVLRKLARPGGSLSFSLALDGAQPVAGAQAVFGNAALVPVDNYLTGAAVADFNGDGKADAVVSSLATGTSFVLRNDTPAGAAAGSFSVAFTQPSLVTGAGKVGVADLNRDGRPDIVITSPDTNRLMVLLNTTPRGAATFSFAASVLQLPDYGWADDVSFADFNGDGIVDVVLANPGSTVSASTDRVLVYTNTSPMGGTTPVLALAAALPSGAGNTGIGAMAVRALEVNGDGRPDIAVGGYGSGSVAVALNTTAPGAAVPTFTPMTVFAVAEPVTSLVTADINGDGRPDLVTANNGRSQLGSTWSVLINTTASGAAKPSFAVTDISAGSPVTAEVADLDGDGKPDVLIADALVDDSGMGGIVAYLNTTPAGASAPSFTRASTYACCDEPHALAAGDFNGDGRPDLLTNDSVGALADVAFLLPPVAQPKAVIGVGTASGTIVLPSKP